LIGDKSHLIDWLAGRSAGDHYPHTVLSYPVPEIPCILLRSKWQIGMERSFPQDQDPSRPRTSG
jgi:hypothetical protein